MKFYCDSCSAKYLIADEKVRGKILKIKCKKCSHIMIVREPDDLGPSQSAQAPSTDAGHVEWFYAVAGQTHGPFDLSHLRTLFSGGQLGDEAYVWNAMMTGWIPARDTPELRDLFEEGVVRRPVRPTMTVSAVDVQSMARPLRSSSQAELHSARSTHSSADNILKRASRAHSAASGNPILSRAGTKEQEGRLRPMSEPSVPARPEPTPRQDSSKRLRGLRDQLANRQATSASPDGGVLRDRIKQIREHRSPGPERGPEAAAAVTAPAPESASTRRAPTASLRERLQKIRSRTGGGENDLRDEVTLDPDAAAKSAGLAPEEVTRDLDLGALLPTGRDEATAQLDPAALQAKIEEAQPPEEATAQLDLGEAMERVQELERRRPSERDAHVEKPVIRPAARSKAAATSPGAGASSAPAASEPALAKSSTAPTSSSSGSAVKGRNGVVKSGNDVVVHHPTLPHLDAIEREASQFGAGVEEEHAEPDRPEATVAMDIPEGVVEGDMSKSLLIQLDSIKKQNRSTRVLAGLGIVGVIVVLLLGVGALAIVVSNSDRFSDLEDKADEAKANLEAQNNDDSNVDELPRYNPDELALIELDKDDDEEEDETSGTDGEDDEELTFEEDNVPIKKDKNRPRKDNSKRLPRSKTVAAKDDTTNKEDKATPASKSVFRSVAANKTKYDVEKAERPKEDTGPSLPDTLKREDLVRGFKTVRRSADQCLERHLKRSGRLPKGKVRVVVTIAGSGKVSNVKMDREVSNTLFESCMSAHRTRWKFPQFTGKPILVSRVFVLQ